MWPDLEYASNRLLQDVKLCAVGRHKTVKLVSSVLTVHKAVLALIYMRSPECHSPRPLHKHEIFVLCMVVLENASEPAPPNLKLSLNAERATD